MNGLLLRWLVNALALFLTAQLLGASFRVTGFTSALAAAAVLGIVNAVIRPVLLVLALPLNLLTLGLFTFVINAAMLLLVSRVIPGLHIEGFVAALLGSVILSFISMVLSALVRR
jgi:putative membrane protein